MAVTDAVFKEVVVEGKKRGKTDAWLVEAAKERAAEMAGVSLYELMDLAREQGFRHPWI